MTIIYFLYVQLKGHIHKHNNLYRLNVNGRMKLVISL